jgi:hypothetical protein
VRLRFVPELTAGRGRLYSGRAFGHPVHAGSFIRKREIVLDRELERQPKELARILVHELFHFAWVRLGNQRRRSFEALLREEWERGARGELGWSAEWRKRAILKRAIDAAGAGNPEDSGSLAGSAAWREYLCESFCDTGAWIYSGVRRHPEYTLAARHRDRRAEWFRGAFQARRILI